MEYWLLPYLKLTNTERFDTNTATINPNGPELLESLKLLGGGPNGPPPPLNLLTIILMLKLTSHYIVNFKS